MKVSRAITGAWVLLVSAQAVGGINAWTAAGPYGGGVQTMLVHPTQSNILLISTSAGLYRTTDSGASWTLIRADIGSASLALDPANPNRIYAGFDGLHLSEDAGATFTLMPAAAGAPFTVEFAADGQMYGIAAGSSFALSRSADGGQTWTLLPRPWPTNTRISTITLDPNDAAVVYVTVDSNGTFRSADRGATWTGPIAGSPGTGVAQPQPTDVWSFAVQPGNSNRLIAATIRGIMISNDAGTTWSDAAQFAFAYWLAFHPTQPSRVIGLNLHGQFLRSDDGGATWPANLRGADPRMYAYIQGVIDPSSPERIWASSMDGPLVSPDWGATFTVRNGGLRNGSVTNFSTSGDGTLFSAWSFPRGVFRRDATGDWVATNIATLFDPQSDGVHLRTMAVAPGNSDVLYVANIDNLLATSRDGGASWSGSFSRFPTATAQPFELAVSPVDDRVLFVATSNEGAWKSIDAGTNWQRLANGLPDVIGTMAIDPANENVVYAAAGSFLPLSIYKSTNGGASWSPTGSIADGVPTSIVIDPGDSNIVYVTAGARLYKSVNAGATWSVMDMGDGPATIVSSRILLIDPAIPTTLIAAGNGVHPGFARSVDGGTTWEPIPLQVPRFRDVFEAALDPLRPNRIIANPNGLGLMEYEVATDLAVSFEGLEAPLRVSTDVNPSVTVRNLGPHSSSAAEVTITLPAWLTPSVPSNCTHTANALTCRLGAIRVDESAEIPLTLTVAATPDSGQISAAVEGHETELLSTNNSATAAASSARLADLRLWMPPSLVIGYTATSGLPVEVTNTGPDLAIDTRVAFNAPAGVTVISATPTVGTCVISGFAVNCALGDLALNSVVDIDLQVRADTHGLVTITGQATSQGFDSNIDQNAASAIELERYADASLQIAQSAGAKFAGSPFQYDITVRNDGPDTVSATTELRLTGASITAATMTGASCTVNTTVAVCATVLAVGGSAPMTVTVNAVAAGSVVATGTVSVDTLEANAADNTAGMTTVVALPPQAPSVSSSGGGGGGGRFDWLATLLLGALLLRRAARS